MSRDKPHRHIGNTGSIELCIFFRTIYLYVVPYNSVHTNDKDYELVSN